MRDNSIGTFFTPRDPLRERMRRGVIPSILVAALAALACIYVLSRVPGREPGNGNSASIDEFGRIEIVRDEWGIPHVFSDTDGGAMYGLGYATAEDRAFQMYFSLRIVQGRLAETVGDAEKTSGAGTAVENDVAMRLLGFYRAAEKLTRNLDNETRTLLEAYSRGVNDYVAHHRQDLPYLFEDYDLEPEPWSAAACIASWWHMGQFFAGDGLGDLRVYNRIKAKEFQPGPARYDDEAAVVQQDDVGEDWIRQVEEFVEEHQLRFDGQAKGTSPEFSHAWVVGGNRTTTGSAVLCSDPQTPVRNPSLFYEFHVRGETFNARGIGVPGSPAILIGWNQNVAWGVTALGADQADLFVLHTDPDRPNGYLFEGESREMDVWTEEIPVRGGMSQNITIRETHYGPVVTELVPDVQPGQEVAVKRVPLCETERETIQAAFTMMRAGDVHEFSEALQDWRFPSVNMVFGDANGEIGYWAIAAIPIRSSLSLAGGSAAHEGNSSAYDWQGFVPYDLLPHTLSSRRGYLSTGNNRPIASFYEIPLGVSTGGGGDTVRSWRLRELLSERRSFQPEDVLDIHYDTTNPSKRELLRVGYHLRDRQKAQLSREAMGVLRHLEAWYGNGSESNMSLMGTELANCITITFRQSHTPLALEYGGGQSGLCLFLRTIGDILNSNPEAILDRQVVDFVDDVLTSAWRYCQSRYGRVPDGWHEHAGDELQGRKLGYYESLDGFASLDDRHDVVFPSLSCVDQGTIVSQSAQSYTQWVPLHDVDSARSILPIGQSEVPGRPSRMSTYRLWEEGKLHPAPITREEVDRYAASSQLLAP